MNRLFIVVSLFAAAPPVGRAVDTDHPGRRHGRIKVVSGPPAPGAAWLAGSRQWVAPAGLRR
jgi:hypothetical protein